MLNEFIRQIFALVAKLDTICIIVALTTHKGGKFTNWMLNQFFLMVYLREKVSVQ